MRFNYLTVLLLLFPLYSFGQSHQSSDTVIFSTAPLGKNSIAKRFSSENKERTISDLPARSIDYPTQIIRLSHVIENQPVDCNEVNNTVEKLLLSHITSDKFTYTTYIICTYNPDTYYATNLIIHSYFDPINDEGINSLNDFLAKYNGYDLFGIPLNIEAAKAVIVSFSISAGTKKNPAHPPFIEYKEDHSSFYFKSNYEFVSRLYPDMKQNFFSNDPDKILPFLDRWVFMFAGKLYKAALRDANYVLLEPEKIFLMDNGDTIFVSGLKYYFAHQCIKYDNHRCLSNGSGA